MRKSPAPITDHFGRVHNYLRISLTERCNLRCFYCMPEEGVPLRDKKEFMSSEETIAIAREFVRLGITKIRLTGGEPLIKKDAANILLELGKLPVELTLTTNGILADKFIHTFKQAGINKVNVSLDSLIEERFNKISRREYFHRIMDNIQLLLDEQFIVHINVVVMKGVNDDEIAEFVKWTHKQAIDVRFIEFMPFDGNSWNWERKVSFKEILDQVNDAFGEENIEKLNDPKHSTSRNFKLRGAKGSFGIISTVTNPFCDTCNRIRLTADGKIKNCLFSQSESDLLSAYRRGEDLEEIIRYSIAHKKKERGGLDDFSELNAEKIKNRSMITIGG